MQKLPQARTENIVVRDLPDEVLIYDFTIDKALCLNDTSAKVFNQCNGATTFDELKRKYNFTDDLIYFALAELKANNLLVGYESEHFAGVSRREVIKRVGLACTMALPLISSLVAPPALSASSRATNVAVCQPCSGTGQGNCAPGASCKTNIAPGGSGRICANNLNPDGAYAIGGAYSGGDSSGCFEAQDNLCCRRSATFNGSRCVCN